MKPSTNENNTMLSGSFRAPSLRENELLGEHVQHESYAVALGPLLFNRVEEDIGKTAKQN